MSQAEALLNSMSEGVPVHTHPVPDTDTYFVIDPITRKIENTNRKKNVIMQYDHNSERFTFELPRYIDGHDMLECSSVTVNVDNIEVVESDSADVIEPYINSDAPDMTDLRVHPNDPEKVISSWLISRNSTQLAGILSFHIEYKCVDSDGNVVYEWSTDTYDEIEIRARKKNGEAAVAEYNDVLEQWRARIFGAGNSVMANIAAEGETQVNAVKAESKTQQEAVELKAAQTLDTIPEDYTEVDAMADEAVRSKADAIVCEATGKSIVVNDSSDDHIRGLKVFGKSTQDGEPTPDNPVEIVSIENPTVSVCGKNLLIARTPNKSASGVTFTVNADNSVTIDGVSTSATFFNIDMESLITYQGVNLIASLGGGDNAVYMTIGYFDKDGGFVDTFVTVGNDEKEFVYPQEAVTSRVYIFINNATTFNNVTVYPTIRIASAYDDKYEIGKELQSINIHRTLPGLPVTSGGNYTDSDGQQWICDEIDFERGVRVQRTRIKTLYDRKNWLTWGANAETEGLIGFYTYCEDLLDRTCLSNAFPYAFYAWGGEEYGVGAYAKAESSYLMVTVRTSDLDDVSSDAAAINSFINFISKTNANILVSIPPIETPLTAEEIAAFKALRTNYPNTTIMNDAGAWMSVKYNADTKTYVENPKTLKLVDSSTGVVYELKIVNGSLTVNPV